MLFFFFQAEDGIRDYKVTGVQTCALPISDDRCIISTNQEFIICVATAIQLQVKKQLRTHRSLFMKFQFSRKHVSIYRSEERRVGKECRARRGPAHDKHK